MVHNSIQAQINSITKKLPNKTAIEYGDKHVTYSELEANSNSIAYFLNDKIAQSKNILVFMERKPELVYTILGIIKAGGIFVPLDPGFPENRIKTMIEEVESNWVVTETTMLDKLNDIFKSIDRKLNVLVLDLSAKSYSNYSNLNICFIEDMLLPENLYEMEIAAKHCYIYFTSGSTGKPKGILGRHRSLKHFIDWEIKELAIDDSFRTSQFTTPSFDASLRDIFVPLCSGGTLCIPESRDIILDSNRMYNWIEKNKITLMHMVPSVFRGLMNVIDSPKCFEHLRYILLAGEMLRGSDVKKFFETLGRRVSLINLYGATETTLVKTFYTVKESDVAKANIPVGKPIDGTEILILDKDMERCSVGSVGEIFIRTPYITSGYFNDKELTRKVFIKNPFSENQQDIIYRTGDLGVVLPDGNVECMGRIDNQVKVRGIRIELGEIEYVLMKYENVKEAVVTSREHMEGEKVLCAHIVGEKEIDIPQLREHLKKHLPEYMLPLYYMQIDKMPLTPNGKVDRRALPEPDCIINTGILYVAPRDIIEEKIADIWKHILGLERVGINDDFFMLGGHSLKATVLLSMIHKELSVVVDLVKFFSRPTIAELAEYIRGQEESAYLSIPSAEHKEYYGVSSAQKRMYILNKLEGSGISYNMSRVMKLEGMLDKNHLEAVINKLVERHESLRTSFHEFNGEILQKVHEHIDITVEYAEVLEAEAIEIAKSFIKPFDLSKAPLLRVALIKVQEDKHILLYDMHHIISDGTTMNIITKEFADLYNGIELPELRIQYKDYSEWQNKLFETGVIAKQEKYWTEVFKEEIPVLDLLTDYTRPTIQSFKGDKISFETGAEIKQKLNLLTIETSTTVYMVLLAAYNTLLMKYTGQEDIVIGTPIAGRQHSDLENMVGMFANTLAMRNQPSGNKTFREFLNEVRENTLKAYENQYYQFEELVENLKIKRDISRNPLFDVMLALQNTGDTSIVLGDLKFEAYEIEKLISKFDITLSAVEGKDSIYFEMEYCTKLFKKETIERMVKHFKNILREVTNNPDSRLCDIELITCEEKLWIQEKLKGAINDYPKSHVYILDRYLKMPPIGVSGELYTSDFIDTAGLKTIDNPYEAGSKLYRTGELVKLNSDGRLERLGRTDGLLILSGGSSYSTEIEEIFNSHNMVMDCAAIVRKSAEDNPYVTLFMVIKGNYTFEDIENEVKSRLADYVFPIGYVRLNSMPYTSSGELNRKLLENSNFMDTIQIKATEMSFKNSNRVKNAVIIAEEKAVFSEAINLKDILSDRSQFVNCVTEISNEKPEEEREEAEDNTLPFAFIQGAELTPESWEPNILTEALKRAAEKNESKGIIYVSQDGSQAFQSYKELSEQASKVLAGLRKLGLKAGDKAIFQLDKNEDYIAAFWGCTIGGIIPVPVTVAKTYREQNNDTNMLCNIWETLDKPVILAGSNVKDSISGILEWHDFDLRKVVNVEELMNNNPDKNWHNSNPDDLAIILFTSGSTGKPKGVMQTHRNILAREISTSINNDFSDREITINWMPLEHVGGIVMSHIIDLYNGCTQIHVKTNAILKEPLMWLDLISQYKATVTWAPNFAYALINSSLENESDRKYNWDLSSMKFILNGGEAINAKTAKKFLKLLEPYGLDKTSMKPAWGMSETCSGVLFSKAFTSDDDTGIHIISKRAISNKVRKVSDGEDCLTFVELGTPIPGIFFRIVASNNNLLREGMIGNIQVKGISVLKGYYNNPELNAEVFTEDGWFETGDLGFIQDGKVTITGRAKDVIIINGINYNSPEIEAFVQDIEGVNTSYTAACAIREQDSDTDSVILFYSSALTDINRKIEQIKEIRKRISGKFGVKIDHIIPLEKESIPKTSIGKIQKVKLSRQYQEGKFDQILNQVEGTSNLNEAVPAWFFKKTWTKRNRNINEKTEIIQNIIIFADELDAGSVTANELTKRGNKVIVVRTGSKFKKHHIGQYEINENHAEEYHMLFEELQKDKLQIDGVIHLWNYSKEKEDALYNLGRIKQLENRTLMSLGYISRELKQKNDGDIKFYVFSSRAQIINENDKSLDLHKSVLPGFISSASKELSWVKWCFCDLEMKNMEEDIEIIVSELKTQGKDLEIAYRNGKRLVPVLETIELRNEVLKPIPIRLGGVYIVTGGLGGVGGIVSKWLMENYKAKLIILGRTAIAENNKLSALTGKAAEVSRRMQVYYDLEAIDGEFMYEAGDISDKEFLQKVIKKAEARWSEEISGVFHLACSMENIEEHNADMEKFMVIHQTEDSFKELFNSKIYGSLALHQLFEQNPDFLFVGFSSVMSFMGAATYSAYSAANSFLNGFCIQRMRSGFKNTVSLNWSMWEDTGLSKNSSAVAINSMQSNGQELIAPIQGINSMKVMLGLGCPQVFIGLNENNENICTYLKRTEINNQVIRLFYESSDDINLDAEKFKQSLEDKFSQKQKEYHVEIYKLDKLPEINGKIDYQSIKALVQNVTNGAEYEAPRNEIEEKLVTIWQEVLGAKGVGINDNFFELGGSSLRAMTLAARIHKVFDVEIQLRDIFEVQKLKELAEKIKAASSSIYLSIEPVEEREYYPVSSAQKRMYVLSQFESRSINYNIPGALLMYGDIDKGRLKEVFDALIVRHESLRTSFNMIDGQLVQQVHKDIDFSIEYFKTTKEEGEATIIKDFIRPFDLGTAPLLRIGIIELPGNKNILLSDMHHIISDGVSIEILTNEFIKLYNGESLNELRIQYKDFSQWQETLYKSGAMAKQEEYWRNVFKEEIPVLNMPTDYQRPYIQSFEGDRISFDISPEVTRKLEKIAVNTATTMYMVLLAVYNVLLSKYTGQEDIVVGTPIAGRPHADLENVIGMFVNTLAMRNHLSANKTFEEFLFEVKGNALKAYENQDYQFDTLVESLDVKRDFSRNPIFDVMFTHQNMHGNDAAIENTSFKPYNFSNHVSKFDMTLQALEFAESIAFKLEYSTKLFKKETIQRLIAHFNNILKAITENSTVKLCEIDILSQAEKQKLLIEFNNTAVVYPKYKTIHRMFEEQVERAPQNVAVIFEKDELTYQELNNLSNNFAMRLIERGVKPGSIVGLVLRRSIQMIVSILGVLKAGGAYLPMDPAQPGERLKYMLDECKASILISESELVSGLNFNGILINTEEIELCRSVDFVENTGILNTPTDPAYIVYTSGTTGSPKGVLVGHDGISNTIQWRRNEYQLNEADRVLQLFPYIFDGFLTSLFTPIVSGAAVVLINENDSKNAVAIADIIKTKRITHFIAVPQLFESILELLDAKSTESLRLVTLAGDKMNTSIAAKSKEINSRLELVNEYGPTEGSVAATFNRNVAAGLEGIIGKPIPNTRIYIVDSNYNLQPIGIAGELCIGGDGLAKGYINNSKLTEEKFVSNPFEKGKLMYRTGDMARWLPEGNIEFLGRIDQQIKIRGFRIEPGEIEAALRSYHLVTDAVVVEQQDNKKDKFICAYFVGSEKIQAQALKVYLLEKLPEYMIPQFLLQIDEIPRMASGKVDKRRLPDAISGVLTELEYVMPQKEVEKQIAAIWEEVLGIEKIGLNYNFFDLGGNSLKLLQMHSKIERLYPGKLHITDIFSSPTVKKIAGIIESQQQSGLKLEYLMLPDEFYQRRNSNSVPLSLNFEIEKSICEALKSIAQKEAIKLDNIFISLFSYLLCDISGCDNIHVQTMARKNNLVIPISITTGNISTIAELFKSCIAAMDEGVIAGGYNLDMLESAAHSKEEYAVLPLIYNRKLMDYHNNLSSIYDILFGYSISNEKIIFKLKFSSKIKSEKARELADKFTQLIELTIDEYKFN